MSANTIPAAPALRRRARSAAAILGFALALVPYDGQGQLMPFRFLTTNNGLLSNRITALMQDSRGYLWIGTDNGICVYDGIDLERHTSLSGLPNNYITCMTESRLSPGKVFVGTIAGGFATYQDGVWQATSLGSGPDSNSVTDIVEDGTGALWIGTSCALFKLDDRGRHSLFTRAPYLGLLPLALTPEGDVAVGFEDRVYLHRRGGTRTDTILVAGRRSGFVAEISATTDGTLWFSTLDGRIRAWRDGRFVATYPLSSKAPANVVQDHQGYYWVGTVDGLVKIGKSGSGKTQIIRFSTDNGLHDILCEPVLIDRENTLWAGSWSKGLTYLTDKNYCYIPVGAAHLQISCRSGIADGHGHIWTAGPGGVWETYRGTEGEWRSSQHDLPEFGRGPGPDFLGLDRTGRLWITSRRGPTFHVYTVLPHPTTPSTLRHQTTVTLDIRPPAGDVIVMMFDHGDRLWCAVDKWGVGVVDGVSGRMLKKLTVRDGLPGRAIRTIFEDRDRNIWFGDFATGISFLPGGNLNATAMDTTNLNSKLPSTWLRAFYQDPTGELWIGTRYGGLAGLHNGTIRLRSIADGLQSNAIWGITGDLRGRLWLATDFGLEALDTETGRVLPSRIGSFGTKAIQVGSYQSEFLWAVEDHGVMVYEYPDTTVPCAPPPVYINRMLASGVLQPVSSGQEPILAYDQHSITVEYVGISLMDQPAVRYQYMLSGVENTWSPMTDHHAVTFGRLKPGSYEFRVRAFNRNGIMSAEPAVLRWTITSPFWYSAWFIGTAALLLLGSAGVILQLRVMRARHDQQMQQEFSRRLIESQEQERKRIAGELHDSLGQNLMIIKNRALIALNDKLRKAELKEQIEEISTTASNALIEVRDIAQNLRPYLIDKLGLTKGLRSIRRRIGESSPIAFEISIEEIDGIFPREHEIHLYRIVQEGITNILKHSEATRATVSVRHEDRFVRITISDNGRGIPSRSSGDDRGFGLSGLAERVRILNGTIKVSRGPVNGTILDFAIPIPENIHGS